MRITNEIVGLKRLNWPENDGQQFTEPKEHY